MDRGLVNVVMQQKDGRPMDRRPSTLPNATFWNHPDHHRGLRPLHGSQFACEECFGFAHILSIFFPSNPISMTPSSALKLKFFLLLPGPLSTSLQDPQQPSRSSPPGASSCAPQMNETTLVNESTLTFKMGDCFNKILRSEDVLMLRFFLGTDQDPRLYFPPIPTHVTGHSWCPSAVERDSGMGKGLNGRYWVNWEK